MRVFHLYRPAAVFIALIHPGSGASFTVGFQATIGSEQNELSVRENGNNSEGGPYFVSVNPNHAGYAAIAADLPNSGDPAPAFQRNFNFPVQAWSWVGGGPNGVLTQDQRTDGSGLITYETTSTTFDGFAQDQLTLWVASDPGPDLLNPENPRDFTGPGYRGGFVDATATIDVSGLGQGTVYVFYGDFRGTPSLSAILRDTDGVAPDLVIEEAHLNGDRANRAEYYCAELDFVTDGVYDEIEYVWTGNGDNGTNGRFGGTVLTGGAAIGGGDLTITGIAFDPLSNEVTLTWSKSGSSSYLVNASLDLEDWGSNVASGISEDDDLNPDDPDHLTVTLPLPEDVENAPKLFFRVEEESISVGP
jgi:hypothetical protein